jgi:hypothetical protein
MIVFCFLWWLPFVVSSVFGTIYCCYFLNNLLYSIGIFLAGTTVQMLRLSYENTILTLHLISTETRALLEAACELWHDLCYLIISLYRLVKNRPNREDIDEQENQSPWDGALFDYRVTQHFQDNVYAINDIHSHIQRIQHHTSQASSKSHKS